MTMTRDELTREALQRPEQFNKRKAGQLLEHMAKYGSPDLDADLAALYSYFMPKGTAAGKLKKAKRDDGAWLALAAGKKDVRRYLNWIYSNGEDSVAMDSHRLHVVRGTAKPKGYYSVDAPDVLVHDDEYARYPDIERVIPTSEDKLTGTLDDATITTVKKFGGRVLCSLELDELETGLIDRDYWRQMASGFSGGAWVTVDCSGEQLNRVKVEEGNRLAVIMGARR